MIEKILGAIICVLLAFLAALGFASIQIFLDKKECERNLPQNVECVWEAPDREVRG